MLLSPLPTVFLFTVAVCVSWAILRLIAPRLRPQPGSDARYAGIDGLRGLLAFAVFIHHGVITWQYLHTGVWALPPSRLHTHLGQSGVALFFMVTAFLFWDKLLKAGPGMDWTGFLSSRFHRLYPVYAVAVLLTMILALAATGFEFRTGPLDLLRRLIGWATFKAPPINGLENAGQIVAYATWSLPYELLFYAALPALALLVSPVRRLRPALVSLVLTLALLLYFRNFSLNVLQCFLGGIAAAYAIRQPRFVRFARSDRGLVLALAALLATVAGFPGAYAPGPVLGLGLFFAIVAAGQDFRGTLTRQPVLWLGEISYGVYLLHGIVLWTLITANGPLRALIGADESLYLLALTVAGVLVVALASLVHLTVERPAIRFGKRSRDPRQARRVPA
ncbi:acyltransferase (plasmid) [Azospirillum sp. B510]|uniref:acyltransferase family protein n=1 Tax=Azospirillum sp. (strain B510) TaxID=137722 RepID=UPI0001C4CEF0|nr:acyltransferase [Azospirillum sp. B510]BAI76639.1 acyltransferase [Azospirillum sp. B510]